VVNAVPGFRYDAEMLRRIIPLAPIPTTILAAGAVKRIGEALPSKAECETRLRALVQTRTALSLVKDESGVPDAVRSVSAALASARPCGDVLEGDQKTALEETVAAADTLVAETASDLPESFVLARGEELAVTVRRQGSDRTWTVIYTTGARGEWRTSYGFNFIINSISKPRSYYTEQVEGGYVIRREKHRRWMEFVPSVYLTWFPTDRGRVDSYLNPTVGLGFNLESPVVFVGATLVYNQNISLNAGFAAHRQRQLIGRYEPGDTVKENLTAEQLHEELFRVNPFVSIGIRFGSNPFAKPEATKDP
ncbi:MAG TPA: hypothetical protein VK399_07700, partial [Longimicrobiaceae bacterium]|nr:hypothetical protein [Longimicrobiaceae bacterium]